MLVKARLMAGRLDEEQSLRFSRLCLDFDALRARWLSAWERKCARCFHHRLVQWRNFLEDYRQDPDEHANRYPYEVRWRVILDLLKADIRQLEPAEADLLAGLDTTLQALLVPGEFVWEKEIERGFPPRQYWYLYGRLRNQLH